VCISDNNIFGIPDQLILYASLANEVSGERNPSVIDSTHYINKEMSCPTKNGANHIIEHAGGVC
jgi:hypothetical protein